jgi:hypothetical protein
MQISRDYGPPQQTSLCALFWRTVLITPMKIAFPVFFVGSVLSVLVYQAWQHPKDFSIAAAILSALVALIGGGQKYEDYIKQRRVDRYNAPKPAEPSVLIDGFQAIKGKVCPIVTIR